MDWYNRSRIFTVLGITDDAAVFSNDGKLALRSDETRTELSTKLDCLLKAMERHRKEAQAIERETVYLKKYVLHTVPHNYPLKLGFNLFFDSFRALN